MKVLVTGGKGMLGRTLCAVLTDFEVIPTDLPEVDITAGDGFDALLGEISPDAVIHCAAMTAVDLCETEVEQAFKINSDGSANVAAACQRHGVRLIAISTDYVFDGTSDRPYRETDIATGGNTVYGKSKFAGEEAVRKLCPDHVICRISWLYGAGGPSFVHTMKALADGTRPELKVVDDQHGNPTSTVVVAGALRHILKRPDLTGTFHLTCEGEATWAEFAREIFRVLGIDQKVTPCTTDEFPRPAPRPANSSLEKMMLRKKGLPPMPHWKDALAEFCRSEFSDARHRYTVSLVTYKTEIFQIMPVISGVLAGGCDRFYIVDNGNSPRLAADIAALKAEKIIYIPRENRGFGAGHNTAIRRSMADGVPFHIIVNPDIVFKPGTLEKIVDFMADTPDAGLVMPKTLNADGSLQYNCKMVPTPADLIFKRFMPGFLKKKRMRRFMMKEYDHDTILEVPYLCGCFMAFNNTILTQTGLFDERFFLYPEDIDITRRMWHAGFRAVYYPAAEVIHAHAQASYKSSRMLFCHIKNMITYFNKWGWFRDSLRKDLNRKIIAANAGRKRKKKQ